MTACADAMLAHTSGAAGEARSARQNPGHHELSPARKNSHFRQFADAPSSAGSAPSGVPRANYLQPLTSTSQRHAQGRPRGLQPLPGRCPPPSTAVWTLPPPPRMRGSPAARVEADLDGPRAAAAATRARGGGPRPGKLPGRNESLELLKPPQVQRGAAPRPSTSAGLARTASIGPTRTHSYWRWVCLGLGPPQQRRRVSVFSPRFRGTKSLRRLFFFSLSTGWSGSRPEHGSDSALLVIESKLSRTKKLAKNGSNPPWAGEHQHPAGWCAYECLGLGRIYAGARTPVAVADLDRARQQHLCRFRRGRFERSTPESGQPGWGSPPRCARAPRDRPPPRPRRSRGGAPRPPAEISLKGERISGRNEREGLSTIVCCRRGGCGPHGCSAGMLLCRAAVVRVPWRSGGCVIDG